jgi:nucleoside-diphosphate-sugar epimerase
MAIARVLVTGGAGYIGSVLVPSLLASGHEVAVLDSFMYQQTSLLECVHDPRLRVVRGDARDAALLKSELDDVDWIFPLACLTGAPLCEREPSAAEGVIVGAIERLLELRRPHQWLVYPNTNSGYGIGESGSHCTEESAQRPVSLYGRLKVAAEKLVLDAGRSVSLRLATAFGISPRMRLDLLVNDFTYRAVTDRFVVLFEADFKRCFIHVRDVARAFVHVMDRAQQMNGGAYNVGLDDANLSKRELCQAIARHVPGFVWSEAEVGADPDRRDYIVSNAKLAATGFRPAVSLDRGISELVRGYQILRRCQYSNV